VSFEKKHRKTKWGAMQIVSIEANDFVYRWQDARKGEN